MTIQKSYNKFRLICDVCGEDSEPFDTISDAVDNKRKIGWESPIREGEWIDVCPECQGEESEG